MLSFEDFIAELEVRSKGNYTHAVFYKNIKVSGDYFTAFSANKFKDTLSNDREFAQFYIDDVTEEVVNA